MITPSHPEVHRARGLDPAQNPREHELLRRNSSSAVFFLSFPSSFCRPPFPPLTFFLARFSPLECRGNNAIQAESPLPPTSFNVFPFESCSCITTPRLRRAANLFGDPNELSVLFLPLFLFSTLFSPGSHTRARPRERSSLLGKTIFDCRLNTQTARGEPEPWPGLFGRKFQRRLTVLPVGIHGFGANGFLLCYGAVDARADPCSWEVSRFRLASK